MINPMKQKCKGFTLIEILIITAIIGILTAVGVPIYQDYVISSKENTANDNLQSIAFMQDDYRRESGQYFPCPEETLGTTQIDNQFFGGKGTLSSGDYSYKMTGGCSSFIASALISNSKAKCFKIDQNRIISSITCPKASTKVGDCTLYGFTRISGGSTGKIVSCDSGTGKIVIKPL